MGRTVPPFLVLMLATAAAGRAGAQPAGEDGPRMAEARARFQAGRAYFDEGEYRRALDDFDASYRLSRKPELLYNMALCHERLGETAEALRLLRSFLELLPEAPNRRVVQDWIVDLQRREAARAERERREREQEARPAAGAAAPDEALSPPLGGQDGEPAPPWYRSPWAWGTAAGVLAGAAVVVAAILASGSEAGSGYRGDYADVPVR